MSTLQFYIRHKADFLQDKFILIFKSDEARDYIQNALKGCRFEKVTSRVAENAARIGINGKVIPYGYTVKLTEEEMSQLSMMDWERTAELIAEGNERFYKSVKEKDMGEVKQ